MRSGVLYLRVHCEEKFWGEHLIADGKKAIEPEYFTGAYCKCLKTVHPPWWVRGAQ